MTHSITPAPDGSYVDVFVPISFKRLWRAEDNRGA